MCTKNLPLICCMNGEIIFGSYAALVEFYNLSRLGQLSLHWLTLEWSNASNVKNQDYTSEILQGGRKKSSFYSEHSCYSLTDNKVNDM